MKNQITVQENKIIFPKKNIAAKWLHYLNNNHLTAIKRTENGKEILDLGSNECAQRAFDMMVRIICGR